MASREEIAWVVYRTAASKQREGQNAVCTQSEWDERVLAFPGQDTLIREGIGNEGEAERLARDLQTPPAAPRPTRPRPARGTPS